jgi:hypothetical protein
MVVYETTQKILVTTHNCRFAPFGHFDRFWRQ